MTTILDAVYIDMKGSKSIVSVKAKPAFQAVLGMVRPAAESYRINGEFAALTPAIAVTT